jgi:hypothetical protein
MIITPYQGCFVVQKQGVNVHRKWTGGRKAMATGKFISYLRVSTDRQGKSGLGLEAQRQGIEIYLNG